MQKLVLASVQRGCVVRGSLSMAKMALSLASTDGAKRD
jgi:hypothetical protein